MKDLFYNGAPVKHAVDIFIRSNGAETGPPLGTILGNLGVNSSKFCKESTSSQSNYQAILFWRFGF